MKGQFFDYLKKTRVLIVFLVTFFSLLIFGTGQYILRSGADDPQVQIANDTVAGLNAGYPVDAISPGPGKTIDKGTTAFVLVYDQDGNPIAGSALYKDKIPQIPKGVFAHAMKSGDHRVTWQPAKELRFASVIIPYKSPTVEGFVVSARSLKETESRIAKLGSFVFTSWILMMLFVAITSATGIHHVKKVFSRKSKN